MPKCKWIISNHSRESISEIAQANNVPKFMAATLITRNLTDRDSIARFMRCEATSFHNPYLLKGMEDAVERIDMAIENGEKITIFGDYDADGVTAAYILYTYLKDKTDNVDCYIPDRTDEGYGLSESAIDSLEGTTLIITVDTGITACEQVEYARGKGIDVIITDHHTPLDKLPDAVSVINPKQADCNYPYKSLAGVGVAFKLVYALSDCDKAVFDRYSHIAAIGTIADLAELTGENRYIVQCGLGRLRITDNMGIRALFEVASIDRNNISASTISFSIGPMLNATGRISTAHTSLKLLLSKSREEATELAKQIVGDNELRKSEERAITEQVLELIENTDVKDDNIIVVSGNGWHHGVIGIVSSRVTERYYKPSVIISTDGAEGKASSRSIEGFNLFEAISACSEDLVKFGGHIMAAGLTIEDSKIADFRRHINEYAAPLLTEDILTPKLYIDCEIDMAEFDVKNISCLKAFEPCGIGNRTPTYCICGATVRNIKISKNHAFLNLEKDGYIFTAPAFNMAEEFINTGTGDVIDIAGTLNINEFNGSASPQMIVKDWHYTDTYTVSRDDVAQVYKLLYTCDGMVDRGFMKSFLQGVSPYKAVICMQVLDELGIIEDLYVDGEFITYIKGENFKVKTDLERSPLYIKYSTERRQ